MVCDILRSQCEFKGLLYPEDDLPYALDLGVGHLFPIIAALLYDTDSKFARIHRDAPIRMSHPTWLLTLRQNMPFPGNGGSNTVPVHRRHPEWFRSTLGSDKTSLQ